MQQSGVRADQVSQVRGFADQRLRNAKDPLEASNRRISIIVQYLSRENTDDAKGEESSEGSKGGANAEDGDAKGGGEHPATEKPKSE